MYKYIVMILDLVDRALLQLILLLLQCNGGGAISSPLAGHC